MDDTDRYIERTDRNLDEAKEKEVLDSNWSKSFSKPPDSSNKKKARLRQFD